LWPAIPKELTIPVLHFAVDNFLIETDGCQNWPREKEGRNERERGTNEKL